MATLLATLVAIIGFIQSGERLAVQSCGFRTRSFWRPLLGCSLVVTGLSFAAQETVLPACFHRAQLLWQDRIHPEWEWDKYFDIALVVGPDRFVSAQEFQVGAGRLLRPVLDDVAPGGGERQLDARLAVWEAPAQRWVFIDGVERSFTKAGGTQERSFARKVSELAIPPRGLVPRTTEPDEMSLRELLRYTAQKRRLGVPVTALLVAAHAKVAFPFTNVVLCALGIPLALRLRRSSRVVNFCVAMALSFLYLWVMELGKALGTGGRLPPVVAAWSPNIVFAGLAAWLLHRWAD